nr:O-antigen ligase family protein [uncultured Flavobacterium sp.]
MKISEKKYIQVFNILLVIIALCLPFGKLSNLAIILFSVFNIIFFNTKRYSKASFKFSLLMLIPLVLEVIFFWNNDSFSLGIKAIEKYVSLLLFAIFLIAQYKIVNVEKLLRYYSVGMILVLLFLELRFIVLFPELMEKYINKIDLWEVGYKFTESFKVHAPALNLQLCFVACVCFYFFIKQFNRKSLNKIFFNFVLFLLSFLHVLIVNTRMALACTLLGFCFILLYEFKKQFSLKKVLISSTLSFLAIALVAGFYLYTNPFMVEKYTSFTFKNIDKVGKIDELENPEVEAYNSAVTRLSIWKTTLELANETPVFGVGSSDANPTLFQHYINTNQKFLSKYNFPVHNQYLNYYLKFGVLGVLGILIYFGGIIYLGIKLENALIISFGIIVALSNLTDDFLNRFDGIGFTSFFYAIFIIYYLKQNLYKFEQVD